MWGMGGAGAGPPLVTAAWRACTERSASPWRTGHDPHESRKSPYGYFPLNKCEFVVDFRISGGYLALTLV